MNIIKKIVSFIKNIFIKPNEVKTISEPKICVDQNKKNAFIKSLKVTTPTKKYKPKIETLICPGDGLGIQNKITY